MWVQHHSERNQKFLPKKSRVSKRLIFNDSDSKDMFENKDTPNLSSIEYIKPVQTKSATFGKWPGWSY